MGGEEGKQSHFEIVKWKGVKDVFKCSRCETCRDTRDEMVEHVLLHFPANEREAIFEELMKEK
jgi:hypothetical protein